MSRVVTEDQVDLRFTKAYHECYSVMYASVQGKVGNADEAEDICQDLFLRLYQRIDEVTNPRAWLYGAMRFVMLEYYKRKGRSDEDIELLIDDAATGYVNGFREARILIQDALDAQGTFSDDGDRSLFELVAIHNFSVADAARHLGITYRQAHYGFDRASAGIVSYLRSRGISNLEDML